MSLEIIPERAELFSVAIAAAGAYWMKYNAGMAAAEQLGAVLIAKNLSNNISSTDGFTGETLKENDLYTAGTRGVISMVQGKGQSTVGYNALQGLLSNVLGRFVDSKMI
jgi:hypothetical protein